MGIPYQGGRTGWPWSRWPWTRYNPCNELARAQAEQERLYAAGELHRGGALDPIISKLRGMCALYHGVPVPIGAPAVWIEGVGLGDACAALEEAIALRNKYAASGNWMASQSMAARIAQLSMQCSGGAPAPVMPVIPRGMWGLGVAQGTLKITVFDEKGKPLEGDAVRVEVDYPGQAQMNANAVVYPVDATGVLLIPVGPENFGHTTVKIVKLPPSYLTPPEATLTINPGDQEVHFVVGTEGDLVAAGGIAAAMGIGITIMAL